MNLIDKDALIEALGIETDCYDCEHERLKYHCDLDPVEACTKIVEAPVVTVTTESAEKAIEVLKNAAWLGAVYSFEETEEAVKTAIRALQVTSAQPNVQDSVKDADCISRQQAIDALNRIARTDNWQAAVSMALLDLPSAQHERAGKWVRKTFEDWWCNQCGIEVCTETPEDYNFCPNCGAKMEGEEHD